MEFTVSRVEAFLNANRDSEYFELGRYRMLGQATMAAKKAATTEVLSNENRHGAVVVTNEQFEELVRVELENLPVIKEGSIIVEHQRIGPQVYRLEQDRPRCELGDDWDNYYVEILESMEVAWEWAGKNTDLADAVMQLVIQDQDWILAKIKREIATFQFINRCIVNRYGRIEFEAKMRIPRGIAISVELELSDLAGDYDRLISQFDDSPSHFDQARQGRLVELRSKIEPEFIAIKELLRL